MVSRSGGLGGLPGARHVRHHEPHDRDDHETPQDKDPPPEEEARVPDCRDDWALVARRALGLGPSRSPLLPLLLRIRGPTRATSAGGPSGTEARQASYGLPTTPGLGNGLRRAGCVHSPSHRPHTRAPKPPDVIEGMTPPKNPAPFRGQKPLTQREVAESKGRDIQVPATPTSGGSTRPSPPPAGRGLTQRTSRPGEEGRIHKVGIQEKDACLRRHIDTPPTPPSSYCLLSQTSGVTRNPRRRDRGWEWRYQT